MEREAERSRHSGGTLGVSADFDALTEPERIAACGLYGENGKLRKEGYLMYVREGRLIIAGTTGEGPSTASMS